MASNSGEEALQDVCPGFYKLNDVVSPVCVGYDSGDEDEDYRKLAEQLIKHERKKQEELYCDQDNYAVNFDEKVLLSEDSPGSVQEERVECVTNTIIVRKLEHCDKLNLLGEFQLDDCGEFNLDECGEFEVYKYDVDWDVPLESNIIGRMAFKQFREDLDHTYLFEGSSLFLRSKLDKDEKTLSGVHPLDENKPLSLHLKLTSEDESCHDEFFRLFFNEIYQQLAMAELKVNGSDVRGTLMLAYKRLEVWPGIVLKTMEYPNCFEITFDASMETLHFSDTIYDYMHWIIQTHSPQQSKFYIKHLLLGRIARTIYDHCMHVIVDVAWDMTPLSILGSFDFEKPTSYANYFEDKYNLKIKDLTQPLLISRTQGAMPYALLPELCKLTEYRELECKSDTSTSITLRKLQKDMTLGVPVNKPIRWNGLLEFMENCYRNFSIHRKFNDWKLGLTPPKKLFEP